MINYKQYYKQQDLEDIQNDLIQSGVKYTTDEDLDIQYFNNKRIPMYRIPEQLIKTVIDKGYESEDKIYSRIKFDISEYNINIEAFKAVRLFKKQANFLQKMLGSVYNIYPMYGPKRSSINNYEIYTYEDIKFNDVVVTIDIRRLENEFNFTQLGTEEFKQNVKNNVYKANYLNFLGELDEVHIKLAEYMFSKNNELKGIVMHGNSLILLGDFIDAGPRYKNNLSLYDEEKTFRKIGEKLDYMYADSIDFYNYYKSIRN